MLNDVELKRIARTTGMRPFQQEKNYIQTIVLKTIYAHGDPAFKGGTALMFTHGLNRFSEDLDFTQGKDQPMDALIKAIREDLTLYGIPAKIEKLEEKERGISFRIGAEGPLFTKEIERCYVRVEISRRETVVLPPEMKTITPLYPDILPFTLSIMAPQEILAEKVRALFMRNKARDLYDAWFLIMKGIVTDMKMINAKLAPYDLRFTGEALETRLQDSKDVWVTELRAIILGPIPDVERVIQDVLQLGKSLA